MSQQQTVLRVQTNKVNPNLNLPIATMPVLTGQTSGYTYGGDGTLAIPYTGVCTDRYNNIFTTQVINGGGTVYYEISGNSAYDSYIYINGNEYDYGSNIISGYFTVYSDDIISIEIYGPTGRTINYLYFIPDPNISYTNETLDLYDDIPIKINKSFAEIEDIAKRNSDYSIALKLPGSKKNNRFFEDFYNVDTQSLYFNVNKRVPIDVLLDDESYFSGYMRLNKISVLNSKVEYDVTLYSTVGDLYGKIGNNLLKDLNYNSSVQGYGYSFNHLFYKQAVRTWGTFNPLQDNNEVLFFYPIVHNGYLYTGDTVNLSGGTIDSRTHLYTSTKVGSYTSYAAAYADGVKRYRINSPEDGLFDNQLKPGLNIKGLLILIFQTYGYTIKSDFFNTPWFRLLYMYGYFSSDQTKFSYNIGNIPSYPYSGVEIYQMDSGGATPTPPVTATNYAIIVQKGTGIPAYCSQDVTYTVRTTEGYKTGTIFKNTSGTTINLTTAGAYFYDDITSPQVSTSTTPLAYRPIAANTYVTYQDGDKINFSQVIDPLIKQIDILSSIAKKFNLIFTPDPDVQNQIIIEPYNFYVGTGNVYDWTDKISFDQGFTVEPVLNFIESSIILTDQEDGDYGNKIFKDQNNRIYGQNNVYNQTDFKSQEKKIDTIFSPEIIRQWDTIDTAPNGGIKLPLGINYASSSNEQTSGNSTQVIYQYKGVKTKPKLFYYMGNQNLFIDTYGESLVYSGYVLTNQVYISDSNGNSPVGDFYAPIVSHTMPIGNTDTNKSGRGFESDSICNLFNSELPTYIGVDTFPTYTENDLYSVFYQNRINNLYNPNTRLLSGNFYLKLSDIKNLQPKDLIKINEQYFTWNKIDSYNLTNRELTKVELIQVNVEPSKYPTRYFKYYYCDNPTKVFKFKTDFTNPSLSRTNFNWCVLYDYNVGILGGSVSGYASTIRDYQSSNNVYVGYTIYEVNKTEYDAGGDNRSTDTLWTYATRVGPIQYYYSFPTYIYTEASPSSIYMNLFINCTEYNSKAASLPFYKGSSTYHN